MADPWEIGNLDGYQLGANMKKYLIFLILLLTWASTVQAGGLMMVGGGTPVVAAAGTWYYTNTTRTDITTTSDARAYNIGGKSDLTAGTVTKLAARFYLAGDATECKIGLYDNAAADAATTLRTSGTCVPANATWCIADSLSPSYDATTTTYIIIVDCNDLNSRLYSNSAANTGVYWSADTYINELLATPTVGNVTYSHEWALAACTGGTCSSAPTP